jgi:phenylalanyl-tRNA synthetase beta chain
MKYLLSWVCKHLSINSWQELGTIEEIIEKLTLHVAEIAHYQSINYNQHKIAFATIINNDTDICLAQYNDEKKVINLPPRKDAEKGLVYIIIQQEDNRYRFATMKDLYSESKNHLISGLYGNVEDHIAYLKHIKKQTDYVIKIDNTSINNRPDLFSHRGLARELALLFNKKIIPESDILFNRKNIKKQQNQDNKLFTINSGSVESAVAVSGHFNERESVLSYLLDLVPLDITPHSYLIDLSNYIMLDTGQPIHIFDKQKTKEVLHFTDSTKGTLECLDNTTIEIEKKHTVITGSNGIYSLVGIIGGKNTSVDIRTKEIIIESAAIKKESIINSAKLYHKKTESVIRNEKGSSALAIEFAILRFLKLMNLDFKFDISHYQFFKKNNDNEIIEKIPLSLKYVEQVIGISIESTKIEKILSSLGFLVSKSENLLGIITIEVPWWRKDIINQDDIIEEIVRHIGYDSLPLTPPQLECKYIVKNNLIETIKNNTILLTLAQEIISYGISNEEQKNKWSFTPYQEEILLKNPYSERQKYMASSFLPNFLDIIHKEIQKGITHLSLFEINPLWHIKDSIKKEELYYTLCIYEHTNEYNFYEKSQIIKKIFYDIGYDFYFMPIDQLYLKHNLFSGIAAHIYYDTINVGICGFIDPLKIYKENKKNTPIFAAEINLDILSSLKKTPLSNNKYPSFDISLLIHKTVKIASLLAQLKIAFGSIMHTKIIDWFETVEWNEHRSITIRIFLMNNNMNELYTEIKEYLIERNCIIR